jgi:hypothetical protein
VVVRSEWGSRSPGTAVETKVLDAVRRGLDTVPAVATSIGASERVVTTCVERAVSSGLMTRVRLGHGEHLALTAAGLSSPRPEPASRIG